MQSTVSLVFDGVVPVMSSEFQQVIKSFPDVTIGVNTYELFGDVIARQLTHTAIRSNTSNFMGGGGITNPPNVKSTALMLDIPLLNFTLTPAMQNSSSAQYMNVSGEFCKDVSAWYSDPRRNLYPYGGCKITSFTMESSGIPYAHVQLIFEEIIQEEIKNVFVSSLLNIMKENAVRVDLPDGTVALKVGPLFVFMESLQA